MIRLGKLVLLPVSMFVTIVSFSLSSAEHSIKLPLNNWASQKVLTTSVGQLLQQHGISVDYIDMRSHKQWGALARGKVHFQVEVWSPSMADAFDMYPRVLDAGTHPVKVREDWWYPSWVESDCPGLPDWRALNDCAQLFSDNNSNIGIFYTGPWNYEDPELIRALELNFKIKRLKSDQELWHLLKQAQINEQPILLLNWSPNWTDSAIPGSFVEFPPYSVECETDPSFGVNKEMTHDCGNPVQGWLKKAKWSGLESTYPCINRFLEKISFTSEMIARASILGSDSSITLEQAAQQWLKEFNIDADKWLSSQCTFASTLLVN